LGSEEFFKDWALSFITQEELTTTLQKRKITDEDEIRVIIGAVKRVGGLGGIQGSGPTALSIEKTPPSDLSIILCEFISKWNAAKGREVVSQRFFLLDYLGEGRCIVFKALDKKLNITVAIKIASFCSSAGRQLQQEKRVLQGLLNKCNGVPSVIYHKAIGRFMVLCETPVGITLVEFFAAMSPVTTLATLMKWAPKLVSILVNIHKRGILHRDIKPTNIIIAGNELYIIDFGISVAMENSNTPFAGTPEFASRNSWKGTYTPNDDFESLCYSLYSLEVCRAAWTNLVEEGRATVQFNMKRSKLICHIESLWDLTNCSDDIDHTVDL